MLRFLKSFSILLGIRWHTPVRQVSTSASVEAVAAAELLAAGARAEGRVSETDTTIVEAVEAAAAETEAAEAEAASAARLDGKLAAAF